LKRQWEHDKGIQYLQRYSYLILKELLDVVKDNNTGVSVQSILFNNLKFADDIDLLEKCRDELQDNLRMVDEAGKAAGLKININKTKTMLSGKEDIGQHLVVDSSKVENVRVCVSGQFANK